MTKTEIENIEVQLLKKYTKPAEVNLVKKSILYVTKQNDLVAKNKRTNAWENKYNFKQAWILQTIASCIDNGFALDGINYTITGNTSIMPTYHCFKNKIYMHYPETVIDLQLIRKGDEYSFAKESGSILYTHTIADPFTYDEPIIIGAYCVIKNSRGEFLETLNNTDYTKIKESSKIQSLWDNWASEFWLKSVIKRACKRHFHDITDKIEEQDNEAIGLKKVVESSTDTKNAIIEAKRTQNA